MTDRLDKTKADKLRQAMPKLLKLLVVIHGPGVSKNERNIAFRALNQSLQNADADIRDLTQLIEEMQETAAAPSLTKAEIQMILDKGIEIGRQQTRQEQAVNRLNHRRSTMTPVGVDVGIAGYSWRQVVEHCAAHPRRLTGWERGFVADMASRFASYLRAPSPDQADKIREIFSERFGNNIE
jgi:hypothetical protein